MRLDKYFKVSRIIKRRVVAKETIDNGNVLINNRPAKASTEVKVGDILTLIKENKSYRVKNIYPSATEAKAMEMYEEI